MENDRKREISHFRLKANRLEPPVLVDQPRNLRPTPSVRLPPAHGCASRKTLSRHTRCLPLQPLTTESFRPPVARCSGSCTRVKEPNHLQENENEISTNQFSD